MATVPGQPDAEIIPQALRPKQQDFMMAAAIMASQGKFEMPDQPVTPQQPSGTGEAARRWQGFESRFPKEQFRPPEQQQNWAYPSVMGNKGRI
jgi:hypothetical protein